MNYEETLNYIYNSNRFGATNGYKNAKELLCRMGNPQERFKSIHIAGTNGKGSVASMITNILKQDGYRVGMFTSPHLVDFTERIQVDLVQIAREDVVRLAAIVKEHIYRMAEDGHSHPKWFEIVTAIGFQYFAECDIDYAVIETGLGGRKDATNIINPKLSIITSISYDHINILGDNIKDIALEKSGIIKSNTPVVIYPQTEGIAEIIKSVAHEQKSPVYMVDDVQIDVQHAKLGKQKFNFRLRDYELKDLVIHLSGRHQVKNAATAITSILALNDMDANIVTESIKSGLLNTKWPGRLERLKTNPDIVVDGAHNIASARTLKEAIEDFYGDRHLILVIGMVQDKDVDEILQLLCSLADIVIVTRPDSDRAMPIDILFKKAKPHCRDIKVAQNVKNAIDRANAIAKASSAIIYSGSLYLVGEVRNLIK